MAPLISVVTSYEMSKKNDIIFVQLYSLETCFYECMLIFFYANRWQSEDLQNVHNQFSWENNSKIDHHISDFFYLKDTFKVLIFWCILSYLFSNKISYSFISGLTVPAFFFDQPRSLIYRGMCEQLLYCSGTVY